jgi:hypothetical protein
MRQMKKRVETLSRTAFNSTLPQKDVAYYKNIVQIEFNAWHYIEGNLWASLLDHIFANLRIAEDEPRSLVEARRDEMIKSLGVQKELELKLQQKIEERKSRLETKATEARTEAAKVQTKLDGVSAQLQGFKDELGTSLSSLPVSVSLTEPEKDLLRKIGVDPGTLNSVRDLRRQYQRVGTGWNRVTAQLKLFWDDARIRRRWLLAALLVLIPLAVGWGWRQVPNTNLPAWFLSAASFVGTLFVGALPVFGQFQKALRALEKRELDIEEDRQQKERRVLELQNELGLLTREYADANREADVLRVQIANVESSIKNTTAGTVLAQFIEDRASATDYRKHLGLLAIIRRDFETLQELFIAQRKEEKKGTEKVDIKKINRIVLYIDDLDRCPPERVVQVLQAIHLLLAFPLFVVVVGVDSRWVTRSLQQSYEWLRDENDDAEVGKNGHKPDGANGDNNFPSTEGATPHDYLEKIFQIPFWLKPMTPMAAEEFIDGLTKEPGEEEHDAGAELQVTQPVSMTPPLTETVQKNLQLEDDIKAEVKAHESKEPQLEQANVQVVNQPDIQQQQKKTDQKKEQEIIDLSPSSLQFTDFEIAYMKELAPLIGRSPRAIKRFLNCYRLIKVRLNDTDLKVFIDDGRSNKFRSAMLLLGVITGTPRVSAYVLEVLDEWPRSRPATLENLQHALAAYPEMKRYPDGERLTAFLNEHLSSDDALVAEIIACSRNVSRFSFRVVGSETLGQKVTTVRRAKPKARTATASRQSK